jgi:hypothetical protein
MQEQREVDPVTTDRPSGRDIAFSAVYGRQIYGRDETPALGKASREFHSRRKTQVSSE